MFDRSTQLYNFRVDPTNANTPQAKFIQAIGRGKRVLEVGCADGRFGAYLTQELGCEVVGIEVNPEAAEEAKRKGVKVVVGDVEMDGLDGVEGPFDVITFGDVLEHLVSPGAVLSRCRGLLSQEGFALVSVPNIAH
jgi:2-polyprenyl-3-methyl-5-hydroxy-6-metoxy-1,4-benzoquinol methylase